MAPKRKSAQSLALVPAPAPAKQKRTAPFRTPQNPFEVGNAGGDEELFKVEAIVGLRWVKGARQYLVKWEGYEDKDNTWETMENLVGCANEIRAYEKKREEEDTAAKQTALDKRQAAKDKAAAEQLATVLLRRLENAPFSTPPSFSNIDTENDPPAASFSFSDSENSAFFSLVVFLKFTRKLGIFHQLPHFLFLTAKTRHFSAYVF